MHTYRESLTPLNYARWKPTRYGIQKTVFVSHGALVRFLGCNLGLPGTMFKDAAEASAKSFDST